MALDGLVIANLTYDLDTALSGGRVQKIYQPENDALVFTIKNNRNTYRLLLSANASLPLVYLTEETGANPMTAPGFCMLLRKHLNGGKILSVTQPGMERILFFDIEHLNEMGDLCRKRLIVELMGKHSNILFCQPDGTIIDSIKHISGNISSVREVLPGRSYFIPNTLDKADPLHVSREDFIRRMRQTTLPVSKALYTRFTGISPTVAEELCFRASIDSRQDTASLSENAYLHLYRIFAQLMEDIGAHVFSPNIVYDGSRPVEFSCIPLTSFAGYQTVAFDSMSEVLKTYYSEKNAATRIRQKSADLRHIVSTASDRARKKYDLQMKQLKDTRKRDKYKLYGEMINTYGYGLPEGSSVLECTDYHTGKPISVPLDPTLSPRENAQKYFDRYGKLKRTCEALTVLTKETGLELEHLDSIATALDIAVSEADLAAIREELVRAGYIKKHVSGKKAAKTRLVSQPFHYRSSDGYDIYVGKNNLQNDELTFKVASGNDWWFHAKGIPGSHVIVKCGNEDMPDRTFEEAARLAAYYSKGRDSKKLEVDYIQRKAIKKPAAARPGFVIYHTNYSMVIEPDISGIALISS